MEDNQVPENNIDPKTTNWLAFALIAIFVIGLFFLTAYLYLYKQNQKEQAVQKSVAKTAPQALVSINSSGFLPESLKIKKGSSVTWINEDTNPHQVASDPHPIHTQVKEFGSGKVLIKGEKYTFVFEKTGTFTFHDHLNPTNFKGTVIVE